ncbi:MAG TPA: hypothetical protein DD740_01305 [Chryseobacterium sp.]|nr:hypothetical protein [Chryseobacterium sp.]
MEGNQAVQYSSYIKYIAGFELLKSKDILKFKLENTGNIVYLSLINLPLDESVKQHIFQSLTDYLEQVSISYKYDEESDRIELQNPASEQIQKIVQNFDIIESVTCSAFTTVRPSDFGTVKRQSGFTIQNADDDLPIIGILTQELKCKPH